MQDVCMLRPAEAAEALGLSLARLRRFAADGRLVTVRTLGGHRRYRQDDVLAVQRWMQMHEKPMSGVTGVSPVHCGRSSPASEPPPGRGDATPDLPVPLPFTCYDPDSHLSRSVAMKRLGAAG